MGNSLGFYDPQFYATEGLISLMKGLGVANTVYRGYDTTPQQLGSVINIKGPSSFTATDVNPETGGTVQDAKTREAQITLNQWKEAKMKLTDAELTFTKEKMVNDHITPMAYALADAIDQHIASHIKKIPWYEIWSSSTSVADPLKARKILQDNKAPMNDGLLYFMTDTAKEAELLGLEAFSQHQGAGNMGVETQVNAYLGKRYGMNFFVNQNAPKLTSGSSADLEGAIDHTNGYEVGADSIHIDGLTDTSTFKAGDIIQITGDEQQYAIVDDVALSGTTEADFKIFPALAKSVADDAVVTIKLPQGSGGSKSNCFAYHRNCIALAMAPLSSMGAEVGARVAVAHDPVTGITLRSRIWYEGSKSTTFVGLDALWGCTVLDPNLGCRMVSNE